MTEPMPVHHLSDDLLLAYAAGTAEEAHALLCAVHLTMCPACRETLELFEMVGGAMLELESSAVSTAPGVPERGVARAPALAGEGTLSDGLETLPRPLHDYVRGRRWAWFAPGVQMLTTALLLGEMPVRLFRLAAGHRVAQHTHNGTELTMVLSGGFVDLGQRYGRGDIAIRDEAIAHDVVVDADAECVVLVVNEHPLVPLTMLGRVYGLIRRP